MTPAGVVLGRRPGRKILAMKGVREMAWQSSRTIIMTWANFQGGNAYAFVKGLGWRKLSGLDPDATNAMLTICTQAQAHGTKVTFWEAQNPPWTIRYLYSHN